MRESYQSCYICGKVYKHPEESPSILVCSCACMRIAQVAIKLEFGKDYKEMYNRICNWRRPAAWEEPRSYGDGRV